MHGTIKRLCFTLYISVSAFLLGNFIAFTCTAGPVSTGSFSLILGVRKSIKGCVVPISWLSTYRVDKTDNKISICDNKQQNWSSLTEDLKGFRNTWSLSQGDTEYTCLLITTEIIPKKYKCPPFKKAVIATNKKPRTILLCSLWVFFFFQKT